MPIRILPDEVASQIAAGEVVERPASVVKELVENALDAGANAIDIRVIGAGQRMIEVADDGCGIPAEELSLAVARHATSKLASTEDLYKITSLGFRGEALASIGSVSHLTITSRLKGVEAGARLQVAGGQVEPVQPVGAAVGTIVQVEDLFYNVPARRKFLKKEITERRQIDSLITRYALAYSTVRLHLTQDDRLSLQTSGNGNRREVLSKLYGVEVARQMLEVLAEEDNLRLTGFISPAGGAVPGLTRSNRNEITFFVNGRPVQDITLTTALYRAYHTLLMVGRYPLAVLFLELPPDKVDVNVHPTKAEVRFSDRDRIFSAVERAIRRTLLAFTPVPDGGIGLSQVTPQRWGTSPTGAAVAWELPSRLAAGYENSMLQGDKVSSETATLKKNGMQPALPGGVPLLRPIGQVALAYLIAEGPDGLYLIDQHAAHERVLFERFMAQRGRKIPAQSLLEPVSVELSIACARLIEEQLPTLEELGFQVETFGHNTFLIRAVPSLLANTEPSAALRVLVEEFEEDETPLRNEVEARIIARICKRAAVKSGQVLSTEEQYNLIRDLIACQSPRTCPHGRPTMIHLSVDLLERQFGRKGA
jgi:DNA mismatch repair protein MutL